MYNLAKQKCFFRHLLFIIVVSIASNIGYAQDNEKALVKKALADFAATRRLKEHACPAKSTSTYAKIIEIAPCSPPSLKPGQVTLEMSAEFGANPSETATVLFQQYILCYDPTEKLISINSSSVQVTPGQAFCTMPAVSVDCPKNGDYRLIGYLSKWNKGNEIEQDYKECKFKVAQ